MRHPGLSLGTQSGPDPADLDACEAMIRSGSRSFFVASLLLPGSLRAKAYPLYAFCRLSDDLVDIDHAADAISRLQARLDQIYAGRPESNPVDRAFAGVIATTGLPRSLPEALIEGLAWDMDGVVCETPSELYAYAARVAGSVGAMMTVLMGVRDPATLARACDLGVAMQLTNIARDVGADAREGRLYLPRSWMREAGLDPDAWLAQPVFSPALASVVARLLAEADRLYASAASGVFGLPPTCRPAIFAALRLYREIGVQVALNGGDSISTRARVSGRRKLALAACAVSDAARIGIRPHPAPALAETAYLVDAATAAAPPARRPTYTDRLLWTAELFVSLDARKQATSWPA